MHYVLLFWILVLKHQPPFWTSKLASYQGLGYEDKVLAVHLLTLGPIHLPAENSKKPHDLSPTQVDSHPVAKDTNRWSWNVSAQEEPKAGDCPGPWQREPGTHAPSWTQGLSHWMRQLRIASWGCAPTWLADKEICFQRLQLVQVYFSSQASSPNSPSPTVLPEARSRKSNGESLGFRNTTVALTSW